jgi:PAS domain S-box-containing protein
MSRAPLVVDDARRHPELRDNPAIEAMGIVAYLGVPLIDADHVIGTMAAFSAEPRQWTSTDVALLGEFAQLALTQIQNRMDALRHAHVAVQQEAVLAHIPSAVVSCETGTGRILTWNALAERLWGPRPETVAAWERMQHEAHLSRLDGTPISGDELPLRAAALGHAVSRREYRLRIPSGEDRIVRATALPVDSHDGIRLGAVMIADDVTEEVDAARRLGEEEERLRALNASSPVGIFESDTEGRVTRTNPRLLQIWDMPASGIMGPAWTERVHPEDLPELVRTWREALAAHTEYEREYRLLLGDGNTRWVHGRSAPLRDAHGEVIGSVGTIEDITERRNSQDQLLQAQKMEAVGRLAGGIAHDLNNLLTAIRADTEFLLGALHEGTQEYADAEHIRAAADRAAELTRQLLAYSRRQLLRMRVVDPNAIVRGVEKLLRRVIGEDIEFVIALDEKAGRIMFDPGQLEQVLVNLAVNASDAMPNGGMLTIATRGAGERIGISVADTGFGMDDATRRRAFEPFFTTKDPDRGTGLGLSTVHGVIAQSGGTVDIESAPGMGTRVIMFFPTTDEQAAAPAPPLPPPPTAATGRILLVEDEALVRSALRRLLGTHGYSVTDAPNGRAALSEWLAAREAASPFDAVVTDLLMPVMDGAELARRLRDEDATVPILFLTGHTDRPVPADLLAEPDQGTGRSTLLQKPFSGEALAAALASIIRSRPTQPGGSALSA